MKGNPDITGSSTHQDLRMVSLCGYKIYHKGRVTSEVDCVLNLYNLIKRIDDVIMYNIESSRKYKMKVVGVQPEKRVVLQKRPSN